MSISTDKYNRRFYKYSEEDEYIDKDLCDETKDDNTYEDEIYKEFNKHSDKKAEDSVYKDKSKMSLSCKLKVEINTNNKMIYLYPGRCQFFTMDISKCCGDVTIKYNGCYPREGIRGNLAIYTIVPSGIIVKAYSKIDPRKKDILKFTAMDECTGECYDFVGVFSCKPCECCI